MLIVYRESVGRIPSGVCVGVLVGEMCNCFQRSSACTLVLEWPVTTVSDLMDGPPNVWFGV